MLTKWLGVNSNWWTGRIQRGNPPDSNTGRIPEIKQSIVLCSVFVLCNRSIPIHICVSATARYPVSLISPDLFKVFILLFCKSLIFISKLLTAGCYHAVKLTRLGEGSWKLWQTAGCRESWTAGSFFLLFLLPVIFFSVWQSEIARTKRTLKRSQNGKAPREGA